MALVIGNFQFAVLLAIMYWTIFMVMAIPYKVRSDRLALGNAHRARWTKREPGSDWLESMKKQG